MASVPKPPVQTTYFPYVLFEGVQFLRSLIPSHTKCITETDVAVYCITPQCLSSPGYNTVNYKGPIVHIL